MNTSLTVCVRAGTHTTAAPLTPRTGQIITGEFGAIISGWGRVYDIDDGIFKAWNQGIDDVTIRNLVLQNAPAGVAALAREDLFSPDRWTIDHNEIRGNWNGVKASHGFTVSNNYIHDNRGILESSEPAQRGGGYMGFRAVGVLWVGNEIAFNGPEQKIAGGLGVDMANTFRGNFVHHNYRDGIWFDWAGNGNVAEDNRVEDHSRFGIFVEGHTFNTIVRRNTTARNSWSGVRVSSSSGGDIHSNTIRDRVSFFWDSTDFAFQNNVVHDNTFIYGGQVLAELVNPERGNRFQGNHYDVPDPRAGRYWRMSGVLKTWTEWQGLGQDTTGSVT